MEEFVEKISSDKAAGGVCSEADLKAAFMAGWNCTAEGYNAECWWGNKDEKLAVWFQEFMDAYKPALTQSTTTPPAPGEVASVIEELQENIRLGREWGYDVVPYCTYEEIETLIRAATQQRGWMDISTAPDGKRVLVAWKIFDTDDKFYEPSIAYRNGDYWFESPGMRVGKPTLWMPILDPTPPAKGE